MLDSDFAQIAAILLVAAVAGGLAHLLRQPLVVAYIVVGVLVGPVTGLVTATEQVSLLAEVGIAVLLFLVGLKLDLHLVRTTGTVAVVTGLAQVVLTLLLGFGLAAALGLAPVEALYVAVALTFSSTVIVVKLLSDKRELDELHGRICVALLVVQDLVVILTMIVITAVGDRDGGDGGLGLDVTLTALRGVAFVVGTALVARHVLVRALDRMAGNAELVVLLGVAWAVAVAAASDALGLSQELGAFLAGVALASTAYREALGARLVSLRDVLLLFFFIDLGSTMDLTEAREQLAPALVLSAFVLLVKPVLIMAVMGLLGYRRRVSFLSGIAMGQISEFSLVLVALGLSLGHVDGSVLGLVTVVALVTIALSTYQVLSSKRLYERLAPRLGVFERRTPTRSERHDRGGEPYDVVVVGGGRFGGAVLEHLRERGDRVLLVDQDPRVLAHWREHGVETLYGDVTEPELASALPLGEVDVVVCTVPELEVGLVLLESVRAYGYAGTVALTAHSRHDAEALLDRPGVLVLRPLTEAAAMVLPRLGARS